MAGKQKYNQVCPIASALDVIGSRWALLVVRELSLGPRRFGDILDGLESASTDMVTSRLRELEAAGFVERTDDRRYRLTGAGFGLAPIMRSMLAWSLRTDAMSGNGADGSPRSLGSDPLRRVLGALGLIVRSAKVDSADDVVELRVGPLVAGIAKGIVGYQISAGAPVSCEGVITMTDQALVELVPGGRPFEELVEAGAIAADTPVANRVLADLGRALSDFHDEVRLPFS